MDLLAASAMKSPDLACVTDEKLVAAARDGGMSEFEELVARHREKIYARAFMMMRDENEAVELSQEAWVKGWQRLKQFHGQSSFPSWMTRITINVCLDRLRWRKRHRADSIEEMEEEFGGVESRLPIDADDPAERLARRELRETIERALAQLSAEQRAAIIMHEFEDMDYKGIAAAMNCSIGTVMSRLFYARRKLAVLLGDLRSKGLN